MNAEFNRVALSQYSLRAEHFSNPEGVDPSDGCHVGCNDLLYCFDYIGTRLNKK